MNSIFKKDYYRMTGQEYTIGIKSLVNILFQHQIKYAFLWRKNKEKKTIFRRIILYKYSRKYGVEISATAEIGDGLYLGHPYNITVGSGVIMGNNINLHKGCTIGSENRGIRKGAPVLGNNVYVGINSTIIGNIRIGDDVMIAPNSFVNFDVPDHSIVIGNPASIHFKENATEGYISFRV